MSPENNKVVYKPTAWFDIYKNFSPTLICFLKDNKQ